ncbi:MAG: ribosome biogenesis GTP-binding protein YihA/YsxC [Deltaproteobacteria bacterium]|jgi:GTP-binding protein|nr:ribosome biogenesis GTP-binding protein YihA/YsxC [Deltaproteobacteria bacterium]
MTAPYPPAHEAEFVISAARESQFPRPLNMEVALLGRSNSGKSSLLNRWIGRRALARVSASPGRTRLINFFRIAWTKASPPFFTADLPGYGFAAAPKAMVAGWQELAASYLEAQRPNLLALLLLDIRRDPQEEEKNLVLWLDQLGLSCQLVATKADKLSRGARGQRLSLIQRVLRLDSRPLIFSSLTGEGRNELIDLVRNWAASAEEAPDRDRASARPAAPEENSPEAELPPDFD